MKNNLNHYVKILSGRTKIWCTTSINPAKFSGIIVGRGIKTNEFYEFTPSDVIAYYTGNLKEIKGLGMPYIPAADVCNILDTVVPDSMGYETHIAARIVEIKINKGLQEYVAEKLKYSSFDLCKSLSAEQVDAVGMAIYNIEVKKQGMIIGDQTGIGKGRVAAAMIRYGCLNGMHPIFISEKPNLFTDIYRDLTDIGSSDLRPFIVNAKESKTDIKDFDGNIVYQAPDKVYQDTIFKTKKLPAEYDFICSTYSQLSSSDTKPIKPAFILAMAKDNLLVMDESHNASGSSKTGEFLQEVIKASKGVMFLSATFAKRPDNMPIYALKTSISDANMTKEELVEAITNGGVALQEILASQLVSEGQMLRRERSNEGVVDNFIVLTEKGEEHKAVFNNITEVLRDIINFQKDYITKVIDGMDDIAAARNQEIRERGGTSNAGVDNAPYFSKVFMVINQILFSIKAKSVAELAIQRLEEGKKPIIAFSSTMESFLDELGKVGDTINIDFRTVLQNGLDGVMRYTVVDSNGDKEYKIFTPDELGVEAYEEYARILGKINKISTGISISPIDIIIDTIRSAGYSCEEVTGRKYTVQMIRGQQGAGVLMNRKKIMTNDAFRMFNRNDIDCLLINQSGSTGASAHAIPIKDKKGNWIVPPDKVKQRVMIVLQPELNINTEVQKRGRINRTGQILKPIYDYVSSVVPAERRLMMMLRKKLKSLDANTSSNQKQSENLLNVADFLNKYGDKVVTEYLIENPLLSEMLGDPLDFNGDNKNKNVLENAASKVSGRVAVLSVDEQEKFYTDIIENYNDYVEYLNQSGQYDLEVEAMNLEAETLDKSTVIQGTQGSSVFAENTYLELCEVNNLKKPFTKDEVTNIIKQNLKDTPASEIQQDIIESCRTFLENKLKSDQEDNNKRYEKYINDITKEKKYQSLPTSAAKDDYYKNRLKELNNAREDDNEMEKDKTANKFRYVYSFLNFFYIGKALYYPTLFNNENVPAICLGVTIDAKKPNPYAPSSIKIKIGISNSDKYIDLPLSGEQGKLLMQIMGLSQSLRKEHDEKIIDKWDEATKKSTLNRKKAYIVTGNILQGYAKYTGKLISFTAKDGSIRKGILMPENYDPNITGGNEKFIVVPISQAERYIMEGMSEDAIISTPDGKLQICHYMYGENEYWVSVPANKNNYDIIKDAEIIALSNNTRDGFFKVGTMMKAYFGSNGMRKLISHLGKVYNLSVRIAQSVFDEYVPQKRENSQKSSLISKAEQIYEIDKEHFESRRSANIQAKPSSSPNKKIIMLKLKAIAKLKLLNIN